MNSHEPARERTRERVYSRILWVFLALFGLRVGAQLLQWIQPVSFLPGFDHWHSGTLPYPLLLTVQVLILASTSIYISRIGAGLIPRHYPTGTAMLIGGGMYFLFILYRLVAGITFAAGHHWLDVPLSTLLHLVLAGILLVLGRYHVQRTADMVTVASYPLLMFGTVLGHLLLRDLGAGIAIASFVPVFIGALMITRLELRFPQRASWKPARQEVVDDLLYMVLVQALLPRFLGFLVTVLLLQLPQLQLAGGLWPHQWSTPLQLTLMLVSAEFLRYWLHRSAHNWKPLWRLHAVHHSPHRLYCVNVGRFHPLEKSLQYLFDALPFILLGVSEEVLALYFVLYAMNGFFQHCNIRVRLGPLNYLVSGPELHRWHHSLRIEESNHNYGNNLIIWDWLFGTRFLPRGREVGPLGLINRAYPATFGAQLRAPFVDGLDRAGENPEPAGEIR